MLSQSEIDAKIAELEAEEREIMAGADVAAGRPDRLRAALNYWRSKKPTSQETVARIERINRYREVVEADIRVNGMPSNGVGVCFDRLLANIGLDDPLAEETIVAADIVSLHGELVTAECSPDIVAALNDVMTPDSRQ